MSEFDRFEVDTCTPGDEIVCSKCQWGTEVEMYSLGYFLRAASEHLKVCAANE